MNEKADMVTHHDWTLACDAAPAWCPPQENLVYCVPDYADYARLERSLLGHYGPFVAEYSAPEASAVGGHTLMLRCEDCGELISFEILSPSDQI
jgi:hypothetical protein